MVHSEYSHTSSILTEMDRSTGYKAYWKKMNHAWLEFNEIKIRQMRVSKTRVKIHAQTLGFSRNAVASISSFTRHSLLSHVLGLSRFIGHRLGRPPTYVNRSIGWYWPWLLATCCIFTLWIVWKRSVIWSTTQSWAFLSPEWEVQVQRWFPSVSIWNFLYRKSRVVAPSGPVYLHRQKR